jgi:DNA polymerase III subunit alpha
MSQFAHLHLHSQYSLLDGANRIQDLFDKARGLDMPAIALTDHGNLFGAIEFYNAGKKAGVKAIVGMEAYVAQGSRHERRPDRSSSNHLVLLAKNYQGYQNLLKLSSRAFLEGFYYKPRIDKELLRECSEGLICLSACLKGELAETITSGEEAKAEALACEYRDLFGPGNYFLEMQYHGIEEQAYANERIQRIAQRTGIPLVASNDCHYLEKSDAHAHDVLLCIGTQKTLADTDRLRYASDNFYMKTADEMFALFPQHRQAIENTVGIAEACDLKIPSGSFHLPQFPVPEGFTLESYFEKVAQDGLAERLEQLARRGSPSLAKRGQAFYSERLAFEIQVIKTMGFAGYFLVVWDFIRYARERGIPVGPGRGSAAGSLVSYALRITNVDPLEYELLFERFLNPDRISMPDIDIDFCMRRRGEVIQYVAEKYGRDHVAQIITFGTLAAKAAIRDVGRVMGLPYAKVDRIAKLIPDMTKSLAEAAKDEPLKSEAAKDPEIAEIVTVGSRLEGLTRHASVHAAGVVITPRPLEELVPLYKSNKDEIMTQWDMTIVESLGLLKMDFLGLRTLTVIYDTLDILRQQGVPLELEALPLDDPETFKLFCDGRTDGIFQFESRGMKDLLRRALPSKFEDLAAFNALYRPGALSVGMVDEYIDRKRGKKFRYILPETREILEETSGVIVYQEQVMQIAVAVAGFTMAEADVLRKAMGKKKVDVMAEQKEKFLNGAERLGKDRQKAGELWDYIEPFAGYGFNKSHSVAYALLAYQTAYLKVHHTVAFMTAMLNSELSSSDEIAKYVRECSQLGIEVLPPDINESGWVFTVDGPRIRFGLGAVKGVGEGGIEAVLGARRSVGRFHSVAQMLTECDLRAINRKVLECLIKAGAFDSQGVPRPALLESLDGLLDYAQRRRREVEAGQSSLFGGSSVMEPKVDPKLGSWSESERLRNEKEVLGFYLTGNPLAEHEATLAGFITHTIDQLKEHNEGETVSLGGIIGDVRRTKIKMGPNAGKFMGRFVLEDMRGQVPVMLFAKQLEQMGHLIADEAVILLRGAIRARGSDLEISAEEIVPLASLRKRTIAAVELRLPQELSQRRMLELRDVLTEHAGDTPVRFVLHVASRRVEVTPRDAFKVDLGDRFTSSVESLLGQGTVRQRFHASH